MRKKGNLGKKLWGIDFRPWSNKQSFRNSNSPSIPFSPWSAIEIIGIQHRTKSWAQKVSNISNTWWGISAAVKSQVLDTLECQLACFSFLTIEQSISHHRQVRSNIHIIRNSPCISCQISVQHFFSPDCQLIVSYISSSRWSISAAVKVQVLDTLECQFACSSFPTYFKQNISHHCTALTDLRSFFGGLGQ